MIVTFTIIDLSGIISIAMDEQDQTCFLYTSLSYALIISILCDNVTYTELITNFMTHIIKSDTCYLFIA